MSYIATEDEYIFLRKDYNGFKASFTYNILDVFVRLLHLFHAGDKNVKRAASHMTTSLLGLKARRKPANHLQ
jgi:hypothetical protein